MVVVPYLASVGLSVGLGYAWRKYVEHDVNPLEPHEVATDVALGLIPIPAGGAVSKVLGRAGLSVAENVGKTMLIRGIEGAGALAITDLAEDFIRPTMYCYFGSKEAKQQYCTKEGKPKIEIHPETLPLSATAGFLGGAIIGGIEHGVRTGKIPVPKIGKVKPTQQEEWMGLYIEKGHKAKPVFGFAKEKGEWFIHFGSYEFPSISEMPKSGIIIKSPIEKKLLKNAIIDYFKKHPYNPNIAIDPEKGIIAINRIMEVVDKSPNPPLVKSLKEALDKSPRLRDVSDDLVKFVTKHNAKVVVYGSQAQEMYGALGRTSHDIDLVVDNAEKRAKELLQVLRRKLGNNVRISPEYPTLIERRVNRRWVHLVDLHDKGSLVDYLLGKSEKYIGWGFRPKPPVKTQEGFYVMRLTEQNIRKGVSILGVYPEGIRPELHRYKDMYDFEYLSKFMANYLKNIGRKESAKIIEENLKLYLKANSPQLRKKIMQQVGNILTREGLVFVPSKGGSYITPSKWISIIMPYNILPSKSPKPSEKPSEASKISEIPQKLPPSQSPSPSKPSYIPSEIPPPPSEKSKSPSPSDISISISQSPSDYGYSYSYPSLSKVSYPYYTPTIKTRIPSKLGMLPVPSFGGGVNNLNGQTQLLTEWVPEI